MTERHGRYAVLSSGAHHHDVALQAVPPVSPDAPGPSRGVGLYHAAVTVEDLAALATVDERLPDRDVDVSPVGHGISKALYFDDLSGNGLEAYVDTRDAPDAQWTRKNRPLRVSDARQ